MAFGVTTIAIVFGLDTELIVYKDGAWTPLNCQILILSFVHCHRYRGSQSPPTSRMAFLLNRLRGINPNQPQKLKCTKQLRNRIEG